MLCPDKRPLRRRWRFLAVFAAVMALAASPSFAINGYFMNGYGPKANGVGGAGVAMPQDTNVTTVNPAGMHGVEPGYDVYFRFMHPQRDAAIDCRGIGACTSVVEDASSREFFAVPGFGYVRHLSEKFAAGISMYANGGLNSTFDRPIYAEALARIQGLRPGQRGFKTSGKVGVDLGQFIAAPSLSYSVNQYLDVGISPLLSIIKFKSYGFESFRPLSSDPTSLTNRGSEYVMGGGVRVGLIGHLSKSLKVGAQYTSKLRHSKFTKYNGLFPDNGKFETPRHYSIGLSWQALSNLTFAFDIHQIQFATVAVTGNSGPRLNEFVNGFTAPRLLGSEAGIGFGWRNQTVFKFGAVYRFSDRITFRLGWNGADQTTARNQTLFGLVSPSSFRDHITGGMSIRLGEHTELSWGYMHAFDAERRDPSSPLLGAGAKANFAGDALDIGISRTF